MHVDGGSRSEAQSTCNHIAHLELVDKALEKKRHTLNSQETTK
jgi:hypothetical protein